LMSRTISLPLRLYSVANEACLYKTTKKKYDDETY